MKKYLMTGVAALALCATFTSCSHDIDSMSQEELTDYYVQKIVQTYEKAFIENIGQPAPDQDWGFGNSTNVRTRAITVPGTNDTYSKFPSSSDIAAYFPTEIPEDAEEVSELETNHLNQHLGEPDQWGNYPITLWDLDWIYQYIVTEGYNLKITEPGTYNVGYYKNHDYVNGKDTYFYYNVYVDVDNTEEVIINRPKDSHFNLYILHGKVKMGATQASHWSSNVISVGTGATFTDDRDEIAANGGVRLFNKGTVYATNSEKYDIGNFCKVYNEGKFYVTGPLTYSPADANASYFMNLGDNAELTAPSMTLNSSGNFYNDGKVNITGATTVTNDGIFWVNAGHYTTGTMTFSAKNCTFYNYCQLIVEGLAHMYDGEFNLMNGSYTEAGSAEMDNFIVNMGSNAGVNIKGDLDLTIGQADGTYQGFRTSGTNDYLRVAGTVTVAEHMYTLQLTGNITYAFGNLVDLGANNTGVQPTYLFNEGTIECPLANLTVTPNPNSCGATWNKDGDDDEEEEEDDGGAIRVIAEDLTATTGNDFDFNDVVFDVTYGEANEAKITVRAAGGTLPLRIKVGAGNTEADYQEVHALWEQSTGIMINTDYDKKYTSRSVINMPAKDVTLGYAVKTPTDVRDLIKIEVQKTVNGQLAWIELKSEQGKPAAKIAVNPDWHWLNERVDITTIDGFVQYVTNRSTWVGSLPSK